MILRVMWGLWEAVVMWAASCGETHEVRGSPPDSEYVRGEAGVCERVDAADASYLSMSLMWQTLHIYQCRRCFRRYVADRFLPDKAIDLVDEAAAKLQMEITSKPVALDVIDRKVMQLEMEKVSLSKATKVRADP